MTIYCALKSSYLGDESSSTSNLMGEEQTTSVDVLGVAGRAL